MDISYLTGFRCQWCIYRTDRTDDRFCHLTLFGLVRPQIFCHLFVDGYFVSYRDPKLAETNETYKKVAEYLRSYEAEEREMTKSMIGTISAVDTPLTPKTKGSRSMGAYFSEMKVEDVQKERDEILLHL